MARNQRDIFSEDTYYHIYNKVVTGVQLFTIEQEYQEFLIRYAKYFDRYFVTYAYCLIPNHFHFLVKVRSRKRIVEAALQEDTQAAKAYINGVERLNFLLENQLSRFFSGLAMKYNNRHNRVGPLFKQGVKRVALNRFRTVQQQMHYIHLNPVHHGLVSDLNAWSYSTYPLYLNDRKSILPKKEVLEIFGGIESYIDFHKRNFSGDIIFE